MAETVIEEKPDKWKEMSKINEEVLTKKKNEWGWVLLMGAIVAPVSKTGHKEFTGNDIIIYFIFALSACILYYKIKNKYLNNDSFKGFLVGIALWLVFSFISGFICVFLSYEYCI